MGIETKMRADPKNITPKNIQFLKDAGASVTIEGKTYGGGPKTAIGGFREAEKLVQSKLEGYGKKDFANALKTISDSSKPLEANSFNFPVAIPVSSEGLQKSCKLS